STGESSSSLRRRRFAASDRGIENPSHWNNSVFKNGGRSRGVSRHYVDPSIANYFDRAAATRSTTGVD
ncbi:MAG TPA: hypothetical protein VFL86_01770, partial [Burkholderiaceae bacterium]|nr:hypothetical protein [Burkholderiaceae bacterium]